MIDLRQILIDYRWMFEKKANVKHLYLNGELLW